MTLLHAILSQNTAILILLNVLRSHDGLSDVPTCFYCIRVALMIYTRTGRIRTSYGKHVLFRAWPCLMPDPFRDISDLVIIRLPSTPHLWTILYGRSEKFWDNYSTYVLKDCINLTASGWPIAYRKNIPGICIVGVGHSQASQCGIYGRQTSTST